MKFRLSTVWLLCLPLTLGAQPIGQFSFDWDLRSTLSGAVDPFWGEYQNYVLDTPPMGTLTAGLEDPGHWKIHVEAVLKQQFGGWQATNLTVPVPGRRSVPVDYHVFRAGYLWYNFQPLEVTFGRDKLHLGPEGHSLVISDSIPFLDMVRLRLPMGDWLIDSVVSSPETRNGQEDRYALSTYLVLHRLQWSSGGLTLGFVEEALLDRNQYELKDSEKPYNFPSNPYVPKSAGTYSLTDFMPVILSHQADMLPFNTSMSLDADWQVTPEWRLWGQLGSDESNGQAFGVPDTDNPDIYAFIVGVEYTEQALKSRFEFGRTDYLWGNFDDDKPGAKALYRILLDNGIETLYLSSPYGPGAQWLNWDLSWSEPDWSLALRTELWTTLKGLTLYYPYPGVRPDESNFIVNGRYRIEATMKLGGYLVWGGPQILVRGETVTPQLQVGLKTTWGAKP